MTSRLYLFRAVFAMSAVIVLANCASRQTVANTGGVARDARGQPILAAPPSR